MNLLVVCLIVMGATSQVSGDLPIREWESNSARLAERDKINQIEARLPEYEENYEPYWSNLLLQAAMPPFAYHADIVKDSANYFLFQNLPFWTIAGAGVAVQVLAPDSFWPTVDTVETDPSLVLDTSYVSKDIAVYSLYGLSAVLLGYQLVREYNVIKNHNQILTERLFAWTDIEITPTFSLDDRSVGVAVVVPLGTFKTRR